MSDSRWIRFELVKSYEKTSVWNVVAKDDGVILGSVFWCGPWRQYAFGPTADCATVYEQRCLRDIADFVDSESRVQDSIEARMGERKAARTAANNRSLKGEYLDECPDCNPAAGGGEDE